MIRHLVPRASWSGWRAEALTVDPHGNVELPAGLVRSMRIARGLPTTTRQNDEARGFSLSFQWLGFMVEVSVGGVG